MCHFENDNDEQGGVPLKSVVLVGAYFTAIPMSTAS